MISISLRIFATITAISSRQPSFGYSNFYLWARLQIGDSQCPFLEQNAPIVPILSAISCKDLGCPWEIFSLFPLSYFSYDQNEFGPLISQCRPSSPTLSQIPFDATKIVSSFISLQGYLSTYPLLAGQSPILMGWLNDSYTASTMPTCLSWKIPQRLSPMQQKATSPVYG